MQTPELAKTLYLFAYRLYQDSKYNDAVQFFRFLTLIDPYSAKYWKGLGASLQMLKQYEKAIEAYSSAVLMEKTPSDDYLHEHIAECYSALGQSKKAHQIIKKKECESHA
jgi:type III secretion system low calcium response chaperone LcrH/SycD